MGSRTGTLDRIRLTPNGDGTSTITLDDVPIGQLRVNRYGRHEAWNDTRTATGPDRDTLVAAFAANHEAATRYARRTA